MIGTDALILPSNIIYSNRLAAKRTGVACSGCSGGKTTQWTPIGYEQTLHVTLKPLWLLSEHNPLIETLTLYVMSQTGQSANHPATISFFLKAVLNRAEHADRNTRVLSLHVRGMRPVSGPLAPWRRSTLQVGDLKCDREKLSE